MTDLPQKKESRAFSERLIDWASSGPTQVFVFAIHAFIVIGAAFFVAFNAHELQPDGADRLRDLGRLLISAAIMMVSWLSMVALMGSRKDARSRATASALEASAEKEETLVDYVEAQLIAAAARQELAVEKSGARADRLASVGFLLMLSSVLVPFGLVYLYMILPPVVPATAGASPQRDWHLLLAGVSFGLLFIAAARGILLAEGRQREVYAREVRETVYYGDLRRALGMAQRLDKKRNDAAETATEQVVRKIMILMLERGGGEQFAASAGDLPATGEHEFLKIVADTIKK